MKTSRQTVVEKTGKKLSYGESVMYLLDKSVFFFKEGSPVYYEIETRTEFAYAKINIYYGEILKCSYPHFIAYKFEENMDESSISNIYNIFKKMPFMSLNESMIDSFIKSLNNYTLEDRYIFKANFFEDGELDTCSVNGDFLVFKRNNNLFLNNYLYNDYIDQMRIINQYVEIIDYNLLVSLDEKTVAIASDNFKFHFFIHAPINNNVFTVEMTPKNKNYIVDPSFNGKQLEFNMTNNNYAPLLEASIDILLMTSANEVFHKLMRKYIINYDDIVTDEVIKIFRMITL